MKPSSEIIALVNQIPDLDEFGKVHGTPWPENIQVYDSIFGIGAAGIRQVIGMLQAIDDGTDYKPRYVLHGLVMYTGRPELNVQGKLLRETLAAELQEDHPVPVKGYLLRQLQLCGNETSAPALGAFLLDKVNWEYAAEALQAIGGDACIAQVRTAFSKSKPSKKHLLTMIQALGWFRDSPSAPGIREHLTHANESVRLTAAWALAMMNDKASVPGLLALVDQSSGWGRLQAIDSSLTLADQLEVTGNHALAKPIRDQLEAVRKAIEPAT
jgi:HEAT repeat protein